MQSPSSSLVKCIICYVRVFVKCNEKEKMLGCEYQGEIYHILCTVDFREVIESTVYESLVRALDSEL